VQTAFKSASSNVPPITVAVSYSLHLLTGNAEHFAAVARLEIQVFKP
jgi:hypothetical protein